MVKRKQKMEYQDEIVNGVINSNEEKAHLFRNNWLISANKNIYDFESAFNSLPYIYWHQNRHFQTGDVGYIYSTKPDQKIRYKFIVAEADIDLTTVPEIDKDNEFYVDKSAIPDSGGTCMKIYITDSIDSNSVGFEALKEHGLKGRIQGGRKLTGELLDYIEECFKIEGERFAKPKGERTKSKSEVSSLAIDLAEELLKLIKAGVRNITYGELSKMTRSKPNPHTQMKTPLIELSKKCESLGLPHISAMVYKKATGNPEDGFKKLFVDSFGYDSNLSLEQMVEDELDLIHECETWQQLADSLGIEFDADKIEETNEATADEEKTKYAKTLDFEELKQIAISKSGKAKKTVLKTSPNNLQYIRDPYISEYAKRRANGICQLCEKPAPFMNSKGEPYLESHHVIWLSAGGDDSVDNVVALCPNCHRKMHIVCAEEDVEHLLKQL